MSETMIERVARAIHAANVKCLIMRFPGLDASECAYEGEVADDHRTLARAAIEAMREPGFFIRKITTFEFAEVEWPKLIDAALSQSPSSPPTPAATPTDSANPPPVESVAPNSEAQS